MTNPARTAPRPHPRPHTAGRTRCRLAHRPGLLLRSPAQRPQRGFTLIECIVVVILLGLVAAALLAINPQIRTSVSYGQDEFVGQELNRACAEKVLATRRRLGFTQVTSTTCNGLGGIGGFAADPGTFTMVNASGTAITTCASATCTITLAFAKSSGTAAAIRPITLRLSNY